MKSRTISKTDQNWFRKSSRFQPLHPGLIKTTRARSTDLCNLFAIQNLLRILPLSYFTRFWPWFLFSRPCNFLQHSTCVSGIINGYDWTHENCRPPCESYVFQIKSNQVREPGTLGRTVPKLLFQYIKMNPTFVKEKSGFFYATVVFNLAEDENIELTEVCGFIRAPRTCISRKRRMIWQSLRQILVV